MNNIPHWVINDETIEEIRLLHKGINIRVGKALKAHCLYLQKRMKTMAIIRNSAKCKLCNDEIESKHVHDYVTCLCGAISVDGGHEYLKRSGEPLAYEDTSIIQEDEEDDTTTN